MREEVERWRGLERGGGEDDKPLGIPNDMPPDGCTGRGELNVDAGAGCTGKMSTGGRRLKNLGDCRMLAAGRWVFGLRRARLAPVGVPLAGDGLLDVV